MMPGPYDDKIKRLELLGGIGAGVLGAGLALLFATYLQQFAIPALLLGVVSHGWAMFQKTRLERQEGLYQPAWADAAEKACWLMLVSLVLYVGYTLFV
ncbi:hypothetical protein AYR66_27140 [Noviherbaspirillum denitrificans]|uniref:Uncharacterized protein n=2 Tax=Noviherbaspirillum denitrificans TaxID=1968433 RepID=A0A254TJ21_9BURK|nr:hypothetical protein AYR66_27140 [Noviherbaspirillum denitrificans]